MCVCVCVYVCVCVGRFSGWQVDPGPLIYQRPRLSDMSSTFPPLLRREKPTPSPNHLTKRLLWKVSDVNESSVTLSQGPKRKADEVSGLFMRCCHPLEGWVPVPSNWGASRPRHGSPLSGPDGGGGAPLCSAFRVQHVREQFHNA